MEHDVHKHVIFLCQVTLLHSTGPTHTITIWGPDETMMWVMKWVPDGLSGSKMGPIWVAHIKPRQIPLSPYGAHMVPTVQTHTGSQMGHVGPTLPQTEPRWAAQVGPMSLPRWAPDDFADWVVYQSPSQLYLCNYAAFQSRHDWHIHELTNHKGPSNRRVMLVQQSRTGCIFPQLTS